MTGSCWTGPEVEPRGEYAVTSEHAISKLSRHRKLIEKALAYRESCSACRSPRVQFGGDKDAIQPARVKGLAFQVLHNVCHAISPVKAIRHFT